LFIPDLDADFLPIQDPRSGCGSGSGTLVLTSSNKYFFLSVPGRKPGKFLGKDMLPGVIMHAYYYRYKKECIQEGILTGAKRMRADPDDKVIEAYKNRQVYCVTKHKFNATATKEEVNREVWFYKGQDKKDKEDAHRILQFRIR
jgi:hypothetical protein